MIATHLIQTVDTHTEGEPTRIITAGGRHLAGESMDARRNVLRSRCDWLRTALLAEPRGHQDMYGALLTPPCHPEADFGVLYMHNSGYMDMCGHATIGVCTALVELGMVEVSQPVTRVGLDTPAGLVVASVTFDGKRASRVCFKNVPAYVHLLDAELDIPRIGRVRVDVAYGGNDFAYFDADPLNLALESNNSRRIVDVGMAILAAANEQLSITDPRTGACREINIATALASPVNNKATVRNVHVFGLGQFDRSPGGTGTSARLAVLHAKGSIGCDEEVVIESGVTGGLFRGRILDTTQAGSRDAVVTEVTGSAYVTGLHQFVIDDTDALKHGFLVNTL